MSTLKTVAVIGAGPGGLVATRYLLSSGLSPIVFERKNAVGGMWAPAQNCSSTMELDPEMKANGSRVNTHFSGFDWNGFSDETHPRAAEFVPYLQGYAHKFIPPEVLRLETTVTLVDRVEEKWEVSFRTKEGEEGREAYDFLVLATGIFSSRYIPEIPGLGVNFKGKVIHSFDYDQERLFEGDPQRIVVVGGALSAVEMAAELALRVASLPKSKREKIKIIHLFTNPPWALPRLLAVPNPDDPSAPKVLGLDLAFYDAAGLKHMPPATTPEATNQLYNGMIMKSMGSDQGDVHPALQVSGEWTSKAPNVGMSENYLPFVKLGLIEPIQGKLLSIAPSGALEILPVGSASKHPPFEIEHADVLYMATGFSPLPSLYSILSPSLRSAFLIKSPNQDPNHFLDSLHVFTVHPALQNAGALIGMARRTFNAMLEAQAMYISRLFASRLAWPSQTPDDIEIPRLLTQGRCEDAILYSSKGSYFRLIKKLGELMGIEDTFGNALKEEVEEKTPIRPFIPAHLVPLTEHANIPVRRQLIREITEKAVSQKSVFVHVFSQLHGRWRIRRTIDSKRSAYPSGVFEGTATFWGRLNTTEGKEKERTLGHQVTEYLYSESGIFKTTAGMEFSASRRYVYRLALPEAKISVWFVKDGENGEVEKLFHELEFLGCRKGGGEGGGDGAGAGDEEGGWKAKGEHLCEKDWYWPEYRFVYKEGTNRLERVAVRFKVKGPAKEYESRAVYERE